MISLESIKATELRPSYKTNKQLQTKSTFPLAYENISSGEGESLYS